MRRALSTVSAEEHSSTMMTGVLYLHEGRRPSGIEEISQHFIFLEMLSSALRPL